jgi:heme-degrading monooxygenase HmoA
MFAAIFEILPKPRRYDDYLALARHLRPLLQRIDGFVDNERFESQTRSGWILSVSTWRDEKSVIRWRTMEEHHSIQETGRFEIFEDYHLRVGEVTVDTEASKEAPIREQRFDETEIGVAKMLTLTEVLPAQGTSMGPTNQLTSKLGLDLGDHGIVENDVFASIYTSGKLALLVGWRDARAADNWAPAKNTNMKVRHRKIRVVRDYGMFDRREAPQFYPDVQGRKTEHSTLLDLTRSA